MSQRGVRVFPKRICFLFTGVAVTGDMGSRVAVASAEPAESGDDIVPPPCGP